ncbi:hypothetical protein SAMD00019534_005210, partial [Acytostelium subglobosum LB1]|uniref:hypothetical protein n=1 Tax=Acytostelium subglobosum LB1 TaxID=1410327 RepID=UPI0006449558
MDAVTICEMAITSLEDDPLTNAGKGSSLNQDGQVQCDASIMDGSFICQCHNNCFNNDDRTQTYTLATQSSSSSMLCGGGCWAGVGAVNGVCNPIKAAGAMLRKQREKGHYKSLGRIRPLMLVADGAKEWASNHGVDTYDKDSMMGDPLITQQSNITYMNHNSRLELHRHTKHQQQYTDEQYYYYDDNEQQVDDQESQHGVEDDESLMYDTVGAIVVDWNGHVAAGVSSGGISLKHPGRVGEAALFGSGCWAQDELVIKRTSSGDGTSTTLSIPAGVGEQIMRGLMAKECCARMVDKGYADLAVKSYFEDEFLSHKDCFSYLGGHISSLSSTTSKSQQQHQQQQRVVGVGDEVEEAEDVDDEEEEYMSNNVIYSGDERLAGLIAATKITNEDGRMVVELVWCHSTDSMALGYISSGDQFKEHSIISRLTSTSATR